MNLKKILVDGLEVETTDAGERAIIRLQGDVTTARDALATAETAHRTAIEAKDREIGTKDAEITDLKGKVLDGAALDKLVADRANLVGQAKRLVADFDPVGKTAAEIKRSVVQSKCGDAAVKDKSDAYVDARFDTLVEGLGGEDRVLDHIRAGHDRTLVDGLSLSVEDARREEQKALDEANDLNKWRTAEAK